MKQPIKRGDPIILAGVWALGDNPRSPHDVPSVFVRAGATLQTMGKKQGTALAQRDGQPIRVRLYAGDPALFRADDEGEAVAWARGQLELRLRNRLACAKRNLEDFPGQAWARQSVGGFQALVDAEVWKACPVIRVAF